MGQTPMNHAPEIHTHMRRAGAAPLGIPRNVAGGLCSPAG
jgi:hypothetical protein